MKRILSTTAFFTLILFVSSCGNKEEMEKLQADNAALTEQLAKAQSKLEEQQKLTKFSQDQAETARRRAEEILKNCK